MTWQGARAGCTMNILWEMGAAETILNRALEGARGLIHGVTCGAGMPYKLAEACARFRVFYYPIVSSSRAFRALWKRAYHRYAEWLGAVVYEDPWRAGGHNGLSNSENPEEPQDPYPRVRELRSLMNEMGLESTPIIMAGGVWFLREWEDWIDNPEPRPDRLSVRHPAAADQGESDFGCVEGSSSAPRVRRCLAQPVQPDGVLFVGRPQRLPPGTGRPLPAPDRLRA